MRFALHESRLRATVQGIFSTISGRADLDGAPAPRSRCGATGASSAAAFVTLLRLLIGGNRVV